MVSTCQQYMITSSVLLWLKSHENLKTLIILQEEISKFAVRFGTYIFIIMNITTLQRINSFSRLQIISLFTICNIVYLTTLQKPFTWAIALPFMPMSLNARTVCFSTFGYYCIVANLSNLNAKTAKRLSTDQAQKYILCCAIC